MPDAMKPRYRDGLVRASPWDGVEMVMAEPLSPGGPREFRSSRPMEEGAVADTPNRAALIDEARGYLSMADFDMDGTTLGTATSLIRRLADALESK